MNILIKDKKFFEKLTQDKFNNEIFRMEMGSKLYGLKTKESLTNILVIYTEMPAHGNSLLSTYPFYFQYETKKTQYTLVTLKNFVNSIIIDGNYIFYDALFSDELRDSKLKFLWESRSWFRTYPVIKERLKTAKFHLKLIHSSEVTEKNKFKYLKHAYRHIKTAEMIFSNSFKLLLAQELLSDGTSQMLLTLNEKEKWEPTEDWVMDRIWAHAEDLRERLDSACQKGSIWRYFCPLRHRDLDNWVRKATGTWQDHQPTDYLDYTSVYEALENQ